MAKIKNPSNKKRYDRYKQENRRALNKKRKAARHQKRMQKFADRKAKGKLYQYEPNPYKKGSKEYILEQNARRAKTQAPLTIAKWDSIMSKLQNAINRKKAEAKKNESK